MTAFIDAALKRQGVMESGRKTFEAHWREAAELVLPEFSVFDDGDRPAGQKRAQKIFSDMAQRALPKFAAIMDSLNTPDNTPWHKLKARGQAVDDDGGPAAEWFEEVNRLVAEYRDAPSSNWRHAKNEAYLSYGVFGNFAIYQDRGPDAPVRYTCCPLREVYWQEGAFGQIRVVHRKRRMTLAQIVEAAEAGQFDKGRLSASLVSQAKASPDAIRTVLHVVEPNDNRLPGRQDAAGMPFRSFYVMLEEKLLLQQGGLFRWPWLIGRYLKAPGEHYGRGPAMQALATIKTDQVVAKASLTAAHRSMEPPYLAVEEALSRPPIVRPNAINPGYLSETGVPLIRPLEAGARFDVDAAIRELHARSIDDVFLVALFLMAVSNPNMTATEVMERSRQQGLLLAPVAGRLQAEFLGPDVAGIVQILAEQGRLPPPPDEILGADYDVEYLSPIATQAASSGDGLAVLRTFEQVAGIAQFKPDIMDMIDADAAFKVLARANGLPAEVIANDETVNAIRDQRAQQQALQAAVSAAPAVAGAAKNMAGMDAVAMA